MALKLHQIRDLLAVARKAACGRRRAISGWRSPDQPQHPRARARAARSSRAPGSWHRAHSHRPLFARRASAAASEAARARERFEQLHGTGEGSVSVAFSSVPALALLRARCRRSASHPEVEPCIVESPFPRSRHG